MMKRNESFASMKSFNSESRTASSTSLHHTREVVVRKQADEQMGCEFIRVGQSIFVTLVRKYEASAAASGTGYTYSSQAFSSSPAKLTPAFRAGLDFGDEILRVNGTDVHSLTINDVYTLVTKGTTVLIDYRAHSNQTTYTLAVSTQHPTAGISTLHEGQITAIRPGSPAHNAGLPLASGILSVNGKSVVGLTDDQILDTIRQGSNGKRKSSKADVAVQQHISVTIVPYKLYAMLLIGLRDAMAKFAITSSPSAVIDALNSDQVAPAAPSAFGAVDPMAPKLTKDSFTTRDNYRPRAKSRSAYFIVGQDE